MKISPTRLAGAHIVEMEPVKDERGFFARTWSADELSSMALNPSIAQCSISFNPRKGTLRGMHYQAAPNEEAKMVRCTSGAIYDVIVDLRPTSLTYCQWIAVELTGANHKMLYIPEGFAHGFQTLAADAEVFYQISVNYQPASARGVRWNDPLFAIDWPNDDRAISERDQSFPDYTPVRKL